MTLIQIKKKFTPYVGWFTSQLSSTPHDATIWRGMGLKNSNGFIFVYLNFLADLLTIKFLYHQIYNLSTY